jgi:putative N6-adenine-specific DNA methylase
MSGFFDGQLNITVTSASGIEKVTKKELERLGYENAPAVNGEISFTGDALAVAKCNLNLRTADRVYIKLLEFTATTFDQLFEGVRSIPWGEILPSNATILVDGKCVKSTLFAVSACQSIVKKAIVVCLQERYNILRLDESGSVYKIEFRIHKDTVEVLLNTSGAGLHKRGYRDLVGIAPIKETLASGMVLLSDYYYKNPFADFFCGSGTIAIEAAMIAKNIAPSLNRKFDFLEWKNFDKKLYNLAVSECKDKEIHDRKVEIFASDIDKKAVNLARRHAERAGVINDINFSVKSVKDAFLSTPNGTIVSNPPYGERVYDKKEAEECYKYLGEVYKKLDNWSAFIITPSKTFPKFFGKKPDRERKLYNSNIECKFYYYYKNRK